MQTADKPTRLLRLVEQSVEFGPGERFRQIPPATSNRTPAQVVAEIREKVFPALDRWQWKRRARVRARKWAPRAYALTLVGFLLACEAALAGYNTLGVVLAVAFAQAIAGIAVYIALGEPEEVGRLRRRGDR